MNKPVKRGAYKRRRYPSRKKPASQPRDRLRRMTPGADSQLKSVFDNIGIPKKRPFTPDRFQIEAVEAILESDCLVTAPTGAGKTWIAVEAIRRVFNQGGRAWYASPLKALTNAKLI